MRVSSSTETDIEGDFFSNNFHDDSVDIRISRHVRNMLFSAIGGAVICSFGAAVIIFPTVMQLREQTLSLLVLQKIALVFAIIGFFSGSIGYATVAVCHNLQREPAL